MAILQSCCFWKSVRKGSYASASYTLIYFGFSSLILLIYINDEQDYLSGEREYPTGESILERGDVTPTTVIFNILFLICSLLLVISSLLVVVALHYDQRTLLLPWIILMLGDVSIELAHLIYLVFTERVIFDPVNGFLFTIDFFIMCLNFYCLLCVVSQYQNYRQGQGCRRIQLATPQIVLHVSQSEESAISRDVKPHSVIQQHQQQQYQLKQLATSPFISVNQPTNISTIPEEVEKTSQQSSPEEEIDQNCSSWHEGNNDFNDLKNVKDMRDMKHMKDDVEHNRLRVPVIL